MIRWAVDKDTNDKFPNNFSLFILLSCHERLYIKNIYATEKQFITEAAAFLHKNVKRGECDASQTRMQSHI